MCFVCGERRSADPEGALMFCRFWPAFDALCRRRGGKCVGDGTQIEDSIIAQDVTICGRVKL
jgi:hypothetical protein